MHCPRLDEPLAPLKRRYVLRGGLEVDLRALYATTIDVSARTHKIRVKYGNVRFQKNTVGDAWKITINLQRQMADAGLTYKPLGTHAIVATIAEGTSEKQAKRLTEAIAKPIGNRDYECVFKAWGSHSVLMTGQLVDRIREVIETMGCPLLRHPQLPIHVELVPRLRFGEVYEQVDSTPDIL